MVVTNTVFSAFAMLLAAVLLCKFISKRARRFPYPPGPKGLPLVGNMYDMKPGVADQRVYTEWGRKFGLCHFLASLVHVFNIFSCFVASDVIHLKMPINVHIMIINNYEAAAELFDRRSTLYSDRCVLFELKSVVSDIFPGQFWS